MSDNTVTKKTLGGRCLDAIERVGNKLPPPAILVCWLFLIVAVIGAIFTVTDFLCYYPDGRDQYYGVIDAKNNCGKLAFYALQGMAWLFDGLKNAPENFCAFRPEIWQSFESRIPYQVQAHSFRRSGKPVFAFWIPEHVELTATTMRGSIYLQMDEEEYFRDPVVIDPIRRNVWLLKDVVQEQTYREGGFFGTLRIRNFSVTDWPLFVADASIFDD